MEQENFPNSSDSPIDKKGLISQKLSQDGIPNDPLGTDHIGVEMISINPNNLYQAVSILENYGFNYLQCQGGYDEGPGKNLVSFYHFISLQDFQKEQKIKEVRIKVFLKLLICLELILLTIQI